MPRDDSRAVAHNVAVFQRRWNDYNRKRGLHYHLLAVDGKSGHQTRVALQLARYYLGLGTEQWGRNPTGTPSDAFVHLLGFPFEGSMKRRNLATTRCKARVQRVAASRKPKAVHGLVWMDGKQCAAWIARWLLRARTNKARRWLGALVSGFRTAAYSITLCIRMCGRVSCPGKCAGAATHHTGIEFPNGAADLSDFWNGREVLHEIGAPLTNHLPYDPVHVSNSGY